MGSWFSSNIDLTRDEMTELKSDTGFNDDNIRRLYSRFQTLDKNKKGYLLKSDFEEIPELLFNPLKDRIIGNFFTNKYDMAGHVDIMESQRVSFEDFAKVFSIFRPVSSKIVGNQKENKVRFLFDMIDFQRTGYFSKEELFDVLELMLGIDVAHSQLVKIVDRVIQEADEDCDGRISFEEFQKAVENLDIETKMAFIHFQ